MTRQAIRFANYSPGADIKVGDIVGPNEMREYLVVVSVEPIKMLEIRSIGGTAIREINAGVRAGFALSTLPDVERAFAVYEAERDVALEHPAFFKARS